MNNIPNQGRPSKKTTQAFDMLFPLLNSSYNEIKELSKKKPDGPLNAMKVKMINRVLQQAKEILINDPTSSFLDLLDEEVFPTNSDAALIISHFKAAMQQYKGKYFKYDNSAGEDIWKTAD